MDGGLKMPILEIEIVTRGGESLSPDLPEALAKAAGRALGAPPGRTWVRLRETPSARYAEDGEDTMSFSPVFVSVLKGVIPSRSELAEEALALAEAVGTACQRQTEQVHILFEPPASGRIAFGGKLYIAEGG